MRLWRVVSNATDSNWWTVAAIVDELDAVDWLIG
jgi:hypothetical protein